MAREVSKDVIGSGIRFDLYSWTSRAAVAALLSSCYSSCSWEVHVKVILGPWKDGPCRRAGCIYGQKTKQQSSLKLLLTQENRETGCVPLCCYRKRTQTKETTAASWERRKLDKIKLLSTKQKAGNNKRNNTSEKNKIRVCLSAVKIIG